jgi:hypothetical protein
MRYKCCSRRVHWVLCVINIAQVGRAVCSCSIATGETSNAVHHYCLGSSYEGNIVGEWRGCKFERNERGVLWLVASVESRQLVWCWQICRSNCITCASAKSRVVVLDRLLVVTPDGLQSKVVTYPTQTLQNVRSRVPPSDFVHRNLTFESCVALLGSEGITGQYPVGLRRCIC